MKVLCKKNYKSGKEISFLKNNFYDILHVHKFGDMVGYTIEGKNRINIFIGYSWFNDYFLSIEESKNILRTELIDKMLK